MPREIPTWRAMTDDERTMANALASVDVGLAYPTRRLVQTLIAHAVDPEGIISERQAEALRDIVIRFRRQIPASVVAIARTPAPAQDAAAQQDEQAALLRMQTLFSGDL